MRPGERYTFRTTEFEHLALIEPDCYSWRELPADGDMQPFMREMAEVWKDQVESARYTIISAEYPNEPYPHGLYFEGWSKAPWRHDPPGKEAPFNYPLTAIDADATLAAIGEE